MNAKLLKVLKWTAIVVICLVVVYTVLLVVSGIKLSNAYAEVKKSGRPMTIEEIIPKQVSDEDNAALLYKSAVLLLNSGGVFWKVITPEEFPGTNHDAVIKFLADKNVVTALGLIKDAADKPAYRYDLDYTKGAGMLLPHISAFRSIQRLLAIRAKVEAERGDYGSAWKTIMIGYKTADTLHNEPVLISQLLRIAMFEVIDQVAGDLAKISPPNDVQADALTVVIKQFADDTTMVVAMDSERFLMGEWAFRQPAAELAKLGDASDVPVLQLVLNYVMFCKPGRQFMHVSYLRIMNDVTNFMKSPWWEENISTCSKIEKNIPRWDILSRLLVPHLGKCKIKHAVHMARVRVSQTAFSLMRHKLAHGKFPATLVECDAKFLPGQPVDPFSGKPLVYRQEGNGFILYSIGANSKDDGGKPEPRGELTAEVKEKKEWDLMWKYEGK